MDLHGLMDFTWSHIVFVPLAFLCVLWFVYKQVEYRVLKLPPGPSGFPIFGYAPFISDDVHKSLEKLNEKYGKICSTTAGLKRFVTVGDYETAKELLNHPAVLGRPPHFFNFLPEEGGFASMSGPLWEQERKFMMQAVRSMGLGKNPWNEIIQDAVAEFVACLGSKDGQPMKVTGLLTQYALTNITSLVYGGQYLNKQPNQDIAALDAGNKTFKRHFKFSNPPAVYPPLLKYYIKFNIDGYREKYQVMEMFAEVSRKEIVKRLNSDEYHPSTDLIKSYLHYSLKENNSPEAVHRSVKLLVGHLSIFISTADTATAPTEWLLLLMAAYPKVQEKVHAELDGVIGRNGLISWNYWKKLPYSMACIKEMLRWATILPIFVPRCASETFQFQGYTIPKGSVIFVNGWAMHRNPKHWKNPNEYVPERFLSSEEKELIKVDGYGQFSFGKRSCPGENITLMTLFQFFTGIMQKFEVRTPTGSPPDLTQHYAGTIEPTSQDLCFLKR